MPEDLSMEVGRLDGRLTSLEGRTTRVETQLDRIEGKIDALAGAVERNKGGNAAVKWIIGTAICASGWTSQFLHWK